MKITRIEATPLAIPLAQEFHWAGGAQLGANLVLFSVHTDDGVVGYGESICEGPRAVAAYGELMARQLVGRSPGDVEAILRSVWTRGPLEDDAAVHAVHRRRHRGRLLGRARPHARRAVAARSSAGRCRTSSTTSAFLQGDDAETLARARARARRRRHGHLPEGRRGARDDDAMRRRRARGDRAGAAPAHRPERGVGRRDRGRADPPARGVRPRLGRAARPALGRRRARAGAAARST